jgi:hypothetical protein
MPLIILHHVLNVSVQLANKRGLKELIRGNRPLRPIGFEKLRLPHFLDNPLADGNEDSLTSLPAALYLPKESWYSFP